MLKKLIVAGVVAVVLAVGIGLAACKKGGAADLKALDELCKLTGEAAVAQVGTSIPAEQGKEIADQAAKACMDTFTNLSDADKAKAAKDAANRLSKCKDKKAKEFIDCVSGK